MSAPTTTPDPRTTTRRTTTDTTSPAPDTLTIPHQYTRPSRRGTLTSDNTHQGTHQHRTHHDRTATPGRASAAELLAAPPHDCHTEPGRVVLAVSPGWAIPGSVVWDLTVLRRRPSGYLGSTLVVGRACGLDDTAARLWSTHSPVERTDDLVAAVADATSVIAWCLDMDPHVMAVYDEATRLGVPVRMDAVGRWPFPKGSPQRARADRGEGAGAGAVRVRWRRRA